MDLMNLGNVSRKTGLKLKQNSKRESNGMEELNDFFKPSNDDHSDQTTTLGNGLARRLSFNKQAHKSPKRSRSRDSTEDNFNLGGDDIFDPVSPPTKKRNSHYIKSLETLSPIAGKKQEAKKSNGKKNTSSSVTKKMALGKSKMRRTIDNVEKKEVKRRKSENLFVSDDEDVKVEYNEISDDHASEEQQDDEPLPPLPPPTSPPPEDDDVPLLQRSAKRSLESPVASAKRSPKRSLESPAKRSPKKRLESPVQRSPKRTQDSSVQQSPKRTQDSPPVQRSHKKKHDSPLPQEQPIRRSSRQKIPTLAFWRNEKIVYHAKKENGAVVHEVSDVIHVPEITPQPRVRKMTTKTGTVPKKKKSPLLENTSDVGEENATDTEPEVPGSEWHKQGSLQVDVFEGPGSDKKVPRTVAWTPDAETYTNRRVEPDNFNLAVLFDQDREFAAAGMLELPFKGVKLLKNNDDTYFMFYVINGVIEITLNDFKFVVSKGCSFEVPVGNTYQMINVGKTSAKTFFVQARYVTIDPDEEWD